MDVSYVSLILSIVAMVFNTATVIINIGTLRKDKKTNEILARVERGRK